MEGEGGADQMAPTSNQKRLVRALLGVFTTDSTMKHSRLTVQ